MKISEITITNVADYLRLETGDYTTATLTAIMSAAKSYIMSYTGLCDETVTGEELTEISDTEFSAQYTPIVSGTLKVYVNGAEVTNRFNTNNGTGIITFEVTPATIPTADYKAGIDAFSDLYIAYMVLCQDMYDTRTMYVDKSNVNKVVETILGMHSANLL